jgi:hypothetical protein
MSRIITIERCKNCPECGYNDDHYTEHDKNYCLITGDYVESDSIPDNCPLPTFIQEGCDDKLARLKNEIMSLRHSISFRGRGNGYRAEK